MEQEKDTIVITSKMLDHVASICEKLGRFSLMSHFEQKPHLQKNNRIKTIHASLKMKKSVLTLEQVRNIYFERRVVATHQEVNEVKQMFAMYDLLLAIHPYQLEDMNRCYHILMNQVDHVEGCYRKDDAQQVHSGLLILSAPPARYIPTLMQDLFAWLKQAQAYVHPLILACLFHYEFLFIEAYPKNNDLMARFWHCAILAHYNPIFDYIPFEYALQRHSEQYQQLIHDSQMDTKQRFVEFMLQVLDEALDDASIQFTQDNEQVSEYVKRMLAIMEYDVPYTSTYLMEQLGLKSKEGFRRNYLRPAIELHLLSMTIPDKPNSRNQRYIKI